MAIKSKRAAFDATVFFAAGVSAHKQELAETIITACAEKNLPKALAAYTEGYVANGLAKGGEITEAVRKLAVAVMDGVNPEAKTVPAGKVKRTPEQHALCRAAARRFNRARAKLNVPAANNTGGARERNKPDKNTPKVLTNPKVSDAAGAHAHLLNMAKMMSGFVAKNRDNVSADVSTAVADFVSLMAKLAK